MLYPICKIKNISGDVLPLHLHEFAVDEIYIIPDSMRESWATTGSVLTAITNQDIEIHNSTGIVASDISTQIIYLQGIKMYASVISSPAFASKHTEEGYDLFVRKHGVAATITANSTGNIDFVIPYDNAKITSTDIVGCSKGDRVDFEVYDTPNGDISGYPNVKLNQFGFAVYMPNNLCSCSSLYDADLIKDMKIRIVYTNNTASDVEIGINFMLHEVRIT